MKQYFPVFGALAVITLALGLALHPLAVDDAFITYRYAYNLAHGQGFVYNPGRPVLSTTAPLWALILAAGAWLGADLPALANALSAVAVGMAALCLFALGRREGTPRPGALAALFYALHPLLWLTLGLETAAFLALALAAVLAYRSGRLYLTAVLLALATLTRADGLVLAAVLVVDFCRANLQRAPLRLNPQGPKRGLGAAALYLAVMLPLLAWLTRQFGSPLPATLAAKRAQAALGITGFYAHTTYLQGLGVLGRARLAQTPLYFLIPPTLLLGLVALLRRGAAGAKGRTASPGRTSAGGYGWVWLLLAWGAAHLVGYAILGVTPYYWYYAPLLPGIVGLLAVGVGTLGTGTWETGKAGSWVRVAWTGLLVATFLRSDGMMVRALTGPVPPPEEPLSKALPEAKGDIYERAGRWLRENTPAGALVGVTEVGILGYYSQRPMVDFLGLLEPDVAEALARGDLVWALLHYQPDYLVLTALSPLYAYDLRADPWFQAAYAPVQTFDDPRFWGSPLTVYRRQGERIPLPEGEGGELPDEAIPLEAEFGDQIRLLGAVTGAETAQPGDILPLTLYWQAEGPVEGDYTVFVHLLGRYERVIAQRDAPPGLGARPTSGWTPGRLVVDPYLLTLPPAVYTPDEAVWEVGLYDAETGQRLPLADGSDRVRFGAVTIRPSAEPLHLDFGPVALTGYDVDRLLLAPGETLRVTLDWEGTGPAAVAVQLVSEEGKVVVRAESDSPRRTFALQLLSGDPPGAYDLEVQVTDPATGATLPLLGADGQPQGDRARLTKIRLLP